MSRVPYIIGDIHGCFDELMELEDLIGEHAGAHKWRPLIVCVGDLVDRGRKSRQVVEHFRLGQRQGSHAVVMGNHESELLRQLHSYKPELFTAAKTSFPAYLFSLAEDFSLARRGSSLFTDFDEYQATATQMWLNQGGRETLASYGCQADDPSSWALGEATLKFLTGLPLLWYDAELIVTHAFAGPDPLTVLADYTAAKQRPAEGGSATRELKEAASLAMWSRASPTMRLDPQRVHVSGHTPRDEVEASEELAYIQLDTGCVYGKRLTAYCHKTRSYLNVTSSTTWTR